MTVTQHLLLAVVNFTRGATMSERNSQSRRTFIKAIGGAAAVGVGSLRADDHNSNNDAPPGGLGKRIEHVVFVTMENRSLDHFLGWMPNVDGKQAGLTYLDSAGAAH